MDHLKDSVFAWKKMKCRMRLLFLFLSSSLPPSLTSELPGVLFTLNMGLNSGKCCLSRDEKGLELLDAMALYGSAVR